METKEIKVKELKLRYNIASMIVYEQVTGKPFEVDGSVTSMVLLIWSIIEANNPGYCELKDLMSWLDDHPEDMRYLMGEVTRQIKVDSTFVADSDDDEKKNNAE